MSPHLTPLLQALVPATGWALLHFVWQGLLIGWTVMLAMHLLRNARPQTRYAVACGGMLLCAALPLSSIIVYLLNSSAPASFGVMQTVAVQASGAVALIDDSTLDNIKSLLGRQLPWIVGLWLAGAALMALRLALGLKWVAEHTRAREHTTNPYWQRRLSTLACRFGIEQHVQLGVSDKVDSPITAGCWKPIVLVPSALVTGMPVDLLEALLAHELAHIKRHDYLVNLLQSVIEVALFYHPSVWAISRRIRIEREQIADDLAVNMLGQPHKLAQALSQLDQFQFDTTQLAHAAHGGNLMSRIKRLLRPDVEPVSWKIAMPLAGLLAAGAMFYAHAAPQPPAPPAPPAAPMAAELPALPDVPDAPEAPELIAQVAPAAPAAPAAPMRKLAAPAAPAAPAAAAPSLRTSYAIVRAGGDSMTVAADTKDIRKVSRLRQSMKSDFLWFRDGDKTYLVSDPAVLARLNEAWKPVSYIDAQMNEQGKKIDAQGKIMNAIGEEMNTVANQFSKRAERDAAVPHRQMEQVARQQAKVALRMDLAARDIAADNTPDKAREFAKKMALLQAEMAPLQKQMAEYQREVAVNTAKLSELHAPMKALDQKMAEASRPMGDLNVRMGELNLKHAEAVREAERALRALMKESLQNGKAIPAPSA